MQILKLNRCCSLTTGNRNLYRSVTTTVTTEKVEPIKNGTMKSWKEIPGPSCLPLVGAMHHFLPGGVFYDFDGVALASNLYDTYGPIVRVEGVVGRDPRIYIYDAEAASQILRGENWSPIRPGFQSLRHYRRNVKKDYKTGKLTGLITDTGDEWKEMRSLVNPVMLKPKTVKLYTETLDEVAKDMVARIQSQRDDSNRLKTNFIDEMNAWSLESIGVVAVGCRIGCLHPNLSENSPAKKLLECVNETLKVIKTLDFSPTLWKVFPTANYKRAMELYKLQEILAEHFINIAVEDLKKKNNSEDEQSILEKLLEINEELALMMASDLLFAGIGSTKNTIAATLYLLAMNPEKQTKLREELRSNDDKRPYLKACVKESMRLMPTSVGTRRVTTKEYNVLGYRIPPNMYVSFGHQLMSLMEQHYSRPKEYLPERWLVTEDDPLHYRHAHSFAHAPFGLGVRNCIARRIAELMLNLFTARMVESFQIEWSGPPPTIKEAVINYFMEPYNFIFKDALK